MEKDQPKQDSLSWATDSQDRQRLPPPPPRRWLIRAVLLAFAITVVVWLLLPQVSSRPPTKSFICQNRLRQIGLGMRHYLETNGTFPPAYRVNEESRERCSWRVLMLPSVEEATLADRYDSRQPWDSDDNMRVARDLTGLKRGDAFCTCPTDTARGPLDTSFVMPVGPGAISDGSRGVRPEGLRDGTSRTILAAELADSGICWTEPRDLKLDETRYKIDDPDVPGLRSHHANVVNILLADGSTQSINKKIAPQVLKGLFTIAGGEPIPDDLESLIRTQPVREPGTHH